MAAGDKESVILVVDDDSAVVQSLAALLELETPHVVLTETSPPRAVEMVRTKPVDMVISDFLMPDMDGISFLLEVRGLYPESTLVLLTGYADKENAIRGINQVGIFQYLEKPWDNDDILTVVRQGLDKRLQLHRLHERARELEARLRQLEDTNRELERRLRDVGK